MPKPSGLPPARVGDEPKVMTAQWWERIHYDLLVMSGTPLVKGVPVWQVMQQLAYALSVDEGLRAYPHLTTANVQAALAYAAASAESTPR
jgi:uncharacterized protein (DUF433 family)